MTYAALMVRGTKRHNNLRWLILVVFDLFTAPLKLKHADEFQAQLAGNLSALPRDAHCQFGGRGILMHERHVIWGRLIARPPLLEERP